MHDNLPDLTAQLDKTRRKLGEKPKALLALVVAGGAVLMAASSFFVIDEGHVGIVKRFGEATKQVNPGLHVKIPLVDAVEVMEIRTRKNVENLRAATFEQMPITAEVSSNWTVSRPEAFELYRAYGGLEQFEARILDPRLRSAAKDAIARYEAEQLIQNRGQVITDIENLLVEEMAAYPVKVDSVQLENVSLPQKYLQSIETKQTERNLAAAEKHRLERQKLEAQREVNTAEAARDAEKARADGKAYATRVQAEAEAEAIKLRGEAEAGVIRQKAEALQTSDRLVDYVRAQNWNGQLPTTMMGAEQSVLWNLGTAAREKSETK